MTESWCNNNIANNVLSLNGYNLSTDLRQDRRDTNNGIGGGLLVYARNGLVILPCDNYNDFNQFLCFNVILNDIKLHVILIYRPPSSNRDNLDKLCNIVSNAPSNTIIIGDLNLPKINWNNLTCDNFSNEFMTTCIDNNFTQYVNFPTHIKNNVLDLVLSNDNSVLNIENLGPLSTSDHVMLMINLNYSNNSQEKRDFYLNWNKADFNAMKNELSEIEWNDILSEKSVENQWSLFENVVNEIVSKNVPKCPVKFSGKPEWMNQTIVRLQRKKARYFKKMKQTMTAHHIHEYNLVTKELRRTIRRAKRKLEVKISKEGGNKGKKKFNKYVKSKLKCKSDIGPLVKEDKSIVTNNTEMANIFNKYFASVFNRDNGDDGGQFQQQNYNQQLSDIVITERDVEKAIDELKVGKAPGPDGFSSTLIKNIKTVILKPLTIIFNRSLRTGDIPKLWKLAKVIPIFKKGSKGDPSNYRPVSLTCIFCKLLEKIIRGKMTLHLAQQNLLNKSQHGFMENRSTQTNLIEFLDQILDYIDNGDNIDIVYLDFSKAFDKISHDKLIKKLMAHGITGNVLNWIKSWLNQRQQQVYVHGEMSEEENVDSGVPQGSVLGPILFVIYINDLDNFAQELDILKKFADDTKGAKKINNRNDAIVFQDILDSLVKWGELNNMEFNVKKCKIMHCGRNNPKFKYQMNNTELEEVEVERDIGITVTDKLKPSQHCQEAANRARAVLGQISRSFHYRDRHVFLRLYMQYVRPHLEYSCSAWSPWTSQDIEILESVQKKAVGMISGLRSTDYKEKLQELGMWTLKKRRVKFDLVQMYKIAQNIGEIQTSIKLYQDRETRQSTRLQTDPLNIIKPRSNLEVRKNFFTVRIADLWNAVPSDLKNARNVNVFKKSVAGWMEDKFNE